VGFDKDFAPDGAAANRNAIVHDFLDPYQKSAVNFSEVENFLNGEAGTQAVAVIAFWPLAFRGHA